MVNATPERLRSNRTVAILDAGFVAIVPKLAREGDILCALHGYSTNCIVRPCKEHQSTLLTAKEAKEQGSVSSDVWWITTSPFGKLMRAEGWEMVFGEGGEGAKDVVFAVH